MTERPFSLLEIGVLAPLGALRVCAETVLPTLRAEIADLRQQAPAAKFIGSMATQQLRERVGRGPLGGATGSDCAARLSALQSFVMTKICVSAGEGESTPAPTSNAPETAGTPSPAVDSTDASSPAETAAPGASEPGEPSAIPGYRDLSAPQVIALLADLRPEELLEVEVYESAHRGRRTILNRIRTLRGE